MKIITQLLYVMSIYCPIIFLWIHQHHELGFSLIEKGFTILEKLDS
jgi:hypothetical protein